MEEKDENVLYEAYAYHEAGHAVIAILLDEGVDLVAIKEHAVTFTEDGNGLKKAEHGIMISMAGDIAVRHFVHPRKFSWIASSDRHEIQKALNRKGVHGAERKQLRTQLRDRTERLLISDQENSAKVEKLAKALLERPVLFINQIQQILPEAYASKDWPPRTIRERNQLYGNDSSFVFDEWINQLLPLRKFRNDERKLVQHRYEVSLYCQVKKLRIIGRHQVFDNGLSQIEDYC